LLSVFPEARFICITRDYRDNFISMQNLADLKLEAPVLSLQVTRWRFVAKEFLRYKKRYPDQFFLVRYEDLVTRPEEIVHGICNFLGLLYVPTVFDFFRKKEDVHRIYPQEIVERIHKNLMNPINQSRMGLWKKELTQRQIRIADGVAGKYAGRFGYNRMYEASSPLLFLRTRPLAIYGILLFKFYQLGSYLPYKISGWLSIRLLLLVRTYHFFFGKK